MAVTQDTPTCPTGADDPGYFDYRTACSRCGRFVAYKDVHPIVYRAAAGSYGEVDDGHSSHPKCGSDVPVSLVVRWVPLREWPAPVEGVGF